MSHCLEGGGLTLESAHLVPSGRHRNRSLDPDLSLVLEVVFPGHQDGIEDLFDSLALLHVQNPVPDLDSFIDFAVLPLVVLGLLAVGDVVLFPAAPLFDAGRDEDGGTVLDERGAEVHHLLCVSYNKRGGRWPNSKTAL